jgi:tetratricopeptide (TPR) repeat protein
MHYRLCYRPALGFAMYFWLAEEALSGRDAEMDVLLRTELLRTVRTLEECGSPAGLDPGEVELDIAVRWGMRALFLRHDPEGALDVFDRIRNRWSKETQRLELAWTHMQLYQAAARIERAAEGDWQQARDLLRGVEQTVDKMLNGPSAPSAMKGLFWWARTSQSPPSRAAIEGQRWRARTLRALALNFEGYLDQQQGRHAEAIVHYQASAMLQRRLAMAGLAPTLTNLAYTMALMGQFENARLTAQEAERWARYSGKEYVLALALNARALVEEYDNHPRDALRYAERALKIAEGLRAPRVRGLLYLTRARAHRYLLLAEGEGEHEPQILDEVLKEVNQAVNLLKNNPPDRVTALIERGCIFREIARRHYSQQRETEVVRSARKSQRDLERAAALAGALDLPDQQALAWTHLGWLWYHTGQVEEAQRALQRAYASIPEDYVLPTGGTVPPMARDGRKEEACLPFWGTLGQAEMLQAYIDLDQAPAAVSLEEQNEKLDDAVRHITLSLAYHEQIADEHVQMTRAEGRLHRRILQDRLSIAGLHHRAQLAASEQGLRPPTRLQKFLDRMFGPADLWT